MAVNQLKVVLSILKEISGDNIPCNVDYNLEPQKYLDIIEAMQDDGLIKGAKLKRAGQDNDFVVSLLDNTKITIKGMEYLNENSTLVKTYKGLKEVREWLPF